MIDDLFVYVLTFFLFRFGFMFWLILSSMGSLVIGSGRCA